MQKLLLGGLKFLAACSGPALILYAIELFEEYFSLGKQTPDTIHTVLVNNHGVYRYITESQNQNFRFFLVTGVLLLLVLFAIIIITKIKKN